MSLLQSYFFCLLLQRSVVDQLKSDLETLQEEIKAHMVRVDNPFLFWSFCISLHLKGLYNMHVCVCVDLYKIYFNVVMIRECLNWCSSWEKIVSDF